MVEFEISWTLFTTKNPVLSSLVFCVLFSSFFSLKMGLIAPWNQANVEASQSLEPLGIIEATHPPQWNCQQTQSCAAYEDVHWLVDYKTTAELCAYASYIDLEKAQKWNQEKLRAL